MDMLKELLKMRALCSERSGLPSNPAPHQLLVTDGEGVAKWEDRLAYSEERVKAILKSEEGIEVSFYKVADEIPTFLQNAAVGDTVVAWVEGTGQVNDQIVVADDMIVTGLQSLFAVSRVDNAELSVGGTVLCIFPETGVYFVKNEYATITGIASAGATAPEITWDGQTSVVKPLSSTFLPTTVPVIPTAAVGQTVVVKAVDADGKPTEWGAAEAASGGPLYATLPVSLEVGSSALYDEIKEAFESGRPVFIRGNRHDDEGYDSEFAADPRVMPLSYIDDSQAVFYGLDHDGTDMTVTFTYVRKNGSIGGVMKKLTVS